jgi:tetratricopeptide (TPR) repeat protein
MSIASILPRNRRASSDWRRDRLYSNFTQFGAELSFRLRLNDKTLFLDATPFSDGSAADEEAVDYLLAQAAFKFILNRYEDAIARDRLSESLHVALGYVWQDHGHIDDATDEFNRAIQLDPKDPKPLVALGFIAYSQYRSDQDPKKLDRAASQFEEALKLNSNFADAYIGLGYVWRARNDLDKATEEFTTARRLTSNTPNEVNTLIGLASIWLTRGQPDKALDELETIQPKPRSADLYISLGEARLAQQRLDDAIEAFHEAALLSPPFCRPSF